MAQHHALAVAELRVHCWDSSVLDTLLLHRLHTAVELTYRHVPQRDVLVHEVLVGVALRPPVLQLRPADAAPAVRGAQPVAVCSTIIFSQFRFKNNISTWLLGGPDPDCELLGRLHVDVLIEDVGDAAAFLGVAAPELHVDPLPGVVHVAVAEGDVVHHAVADRADGQAFKMRK